MVINRYSVLPDQKIVNTHVDQDLSLVNRVLATKQQAYNEAEAFDQQQEGVFGKYKVRNADIARRDALHNEYVTKAQDIVQTQYQGDYGAALPALRKLANGYAGNEFFSRAGSALEREQEDYKTRADLRKSGKNVLDFAPGMTQKAIYNEDGTYNDISYDTQGQSDWIKARKEALGKIEASGGSGALRGAGFAGLLKHIDSEGVGATDVQRVALANFRGYLNSSDGQQEYRYLRAQGYEDKEAQKRVFANLAGAGENQIHSKSKTDYLSDPNFTKDSEKAAKDNAFVSTGQQSSAVDYNPTPGLEVGMFQKKDRAGAGKLFYDGRAAGANPKDAEAYYKAHERGKLTYAQMTPEQKITTAGMVKDFYPAIAKRLAAGGKVSDAEMDGIAKVMVRQLSGIKNMKIGAAVRSIPATQDYGDGVGKGEVGATKFYLGSDNIQDADASKLLGTVVYNIKTGEKMSGKDFVEKVMIPAKEAAVKGKTMNGSVRITGNYNPANPFSLLTGDDRFADAKQMALGADQYAVAGLNEEIRHTDGSPSDELSRRRMDVGRPITTAMRNINTVVTVTVGNHDVRMKWRPDGKFEFPDIKDKKGNPQITEDAANLLGHILDGKPIE